tara:strand:+ start:650 stop:1060 length:411 start_codon:yes stop_codon:yes gene_type:complete
MTSFLLKKISEIGGLMDFQFFRNDYNEPEAIFSGGHLALGHFLTTELVGEVYKINDIRSAIARLEKYQIESFEWVGKQYKLVIEQGDVCITALVLDHDFDDELPESTQLYDDEQKSECGLSDFSAVIDQWLVFCGE